jgi:hypothetical protein
VHHWNGVSIKMSATYDRISLIGGMENGQSINKLWGTNSNNLFGVGYKGMISHFDGHTWTKMASNTTVDLQDIYGLDANHIWAAGMNSDGNGTAILSFDGANWQKLYEGNYYGFSSVWTNEGTKLFIDGDSGPWTFILNTKSFIKLTTPAKYVMYCVRATNVNDIFFTGQNNEITHFNGLTFLLYQNIQGPNSAEIEWRTIKAAKDFVVAGGDYYFGYNSAPLVLRGYR